MRRLLLSVLAVLLSVVFAGTMLSQQDGWELRPVPESMTDAPAEPSTEPTNRPASLPEPGELLESGSDGRAFLIEADYIGFVTRLTDTGFRIAGHAIDGLGNPKAPVNVVFGGSTLVEKGIFRTDGGDYSLYMASRSELMNDAYVMVFGTPQQDGQLKASLIVLLELDHST